MPARNRDHYDAAYQRNAPIIRANAYANPDTQCMSRCTCNSTHIADCTCGMACGLRLDQHPPTRTGKPASWDAGHAESGIVGSKLRAEVARCNRSQGASEGNRRRAKLEPTRHW